MTVQRTVFHKTSERSFEQQEDRWTFVDDGQDRYVIHERTTGNPFSGRQPNTEEKRIPVDAFLMGDFDRTAQEKLDRLLNKQGARSRLSATSSYEKSAGDAVLVAGGWASRPNIRYRSAFLRGRRERQA